MSCGPRSGTDAEWLCAHFGVEENGNVSPSLDPQGELRGKNILVQRRSLDESARAAGLDLEQASVRLQTALERLCTIRLHRPHPHLDDKIVTANNGLMISALARSHQVLERCGLEGNVYLVAARRAAEFLRAELYDETRGVLFRSWRVTRGASEGFAEDYAYLIQGSDRSLRGLVRTALAGMGRTAAGNHGCPFRGWGAWGLFQHRGRCGPHRLAAEGRLRRRGASGE
jgi:uncharacterized protein YyaL (SSP411 family)